MATATPMDRSSQAESDIRALLETQASAIRAKDPEAALAPYAPDTGKLELVAPLQYAGVARLDKEGVAGWFATWEGPIGYELSDLGVVVSGDFAFCDGFVRISGRRTDGRQIGVWMRATVGLLRDRDGWQIVHQHTSAPFYVDGGFRAGAGFQG